MSVVYTTVNGQILHENRGGVVSYFVSDPLGSVVMVRDNAGNTVYEAEYDPYGNVQSETGTNPSEFGYVGTLGYVKDSAFSLYVRARYLLTNLGRWLTKDPLWPSEPGFVYAGASPSMWADSSGLKPVRPCDCPSTLDGRVGYVYIDCSCKGKPMGILPEFGENGIGSDTLDIDPKCGKWIRADAILINPPMKPKPGLYKVRGLSCVVISCQGFRWGAGYCCVPLLADLGLCSMTYQGARHQKGKPWGSFESRKFDEAKCGPPIVR